MPAEGSADQRMDGGVSTLGQQVQLEARGTRLTLNTANQMHALYQLRQGTCRLEAITMVIRESRKRPSVEGGSMSRDLKERRRGRDRVWCSRVLRSAAAAARTRVRGIC